MDIKYEYKIQNSHNPDLVGFFGLLLKIDKRVNPQNYKYENENNIQQDIQNKRF